MMIKNETTKDMISNFRQLANLHTCLYQAEQKVNFADKGLQDADIIVVTVPIFFPTL